MTRRLLKNGDILNLSNKRGSLTIWVQQSEEVKPAESFIPMHWGKHFMNGLGVNALMPSACDLIFKQPELKHKEIKIEKLTLPWQMTVMRVCQDLRLITVVRQLLQFFDYTTCGLYGRGSGVVVLRASHYDTPSAEVIARLDQMLGMVGEAPMLNSDDPKRGVSKKFWLSKAM